MVSSSMVASTDPSAAWKTWPVSLGNFRWMLTSIKIWATSLAMDPSLSNSRVRRVEKGFLLQVEGGLHGYHEVICGPRVGISVRVNVETWWTIVACILDDV